jgi:hypothetical protein
VRFLCEPFERPVATHVLPLLVAVFIPGCSKPPASAPGTTAAAVPTATGAAPSQTPAADAPVDPAHPETKWIGKIPYDVFYDQPLTVASDATPTAVAVTTPVTPAAGTPATPVPAATENPTTPAPAAAGESSGDLASIPMPLLVDEVKQIRTRLEKNLQKVGDFNKNVAAIAQDGAVLSAIAVAVTKNPESVNWKDKAPYIRDMANEMYMKAEGSGSKPYNATKKPFEDLKRLLDGESASGDAPADKSLAEVADRGELMKRLNANYDAVKSRSSSANLVKAESEKIQSDLAVMMFLMTVMADPSYDRADDPRYVEFVKTINEQQKTALEAAKSGDYDTYSATIGKINNTCNECHMVFRTASE